MREALAPSTGDDTMFDALISARDRFGDKEILEDQDCKPMTYTGLIRAAFVLGRKIAALTQPAERVGILLPSSMGVVVVYYGLHAHGRVPTMLNFTSGEANVKAAIKAAGVKKILTARRFIEQAKLDDLVTAIETMAEIVWLDDVRKSIGLPDKLYGLLGGMAPRTFRTPTSPSSPGVILFTSGGFGTPQGGCAQDRCMGRSLRASLRIALNRLEAKTIRRRQRRRRRGRSTPARDRAMPPVPRRASRVSARQQRAVPGRAASKSGGSAAR
ncbi:AMP-binding protein [Phenylobacterium sp.]|uniref:AMP-binding protein n=1 Tax=Phenylobacterium sp. TaxID=1871053 RepID=UPI0025E759DA|nr:AMP-binding protein [Phenylobacterium sp.]